jgi:hypothetical protein
MGFLFGVAHRKRAAGAMPSATVAEPSLSDLCAVVGHSWRGFRHVRSRHLEILDSDFGGKESLASGF